MSKTKYTAFRCPVDLLAKAQAKAKQDRRSLSNYLILLIENDTSDVELPAKPEKASKPKAAKVVAKVVAKVAAKVAKAPKATKAAKAPKAAKKPAKR